MGQKQFWLRVSIQIKFFSIKRQKLSVNRRWNGTKVHEMQYKLLYRMCVGQERCFASQDSFSVLVTSFTRYPLCYFLICAPFSILLFKWRFNHVTYHYRNQGRCWLWILWDEPFHPRRNGSTVSFLLHNNPLGPLLQDADVLNIGRNFFCKFCPRHFPNRCSR